jgi:hypothetical protein
MLRGLREPVLEAVSAGSLYDFAAHVPDARAMRGRGTAYAVRLPDGGPRIVVRRSRHGGMLASLTGDRFIAPTRAPRELRTALRLQRLGIPTPEVVAYATYPAGGPLRRADVATREVPEARDLGALLAETSPGDARADGWAAVSRLLARMRDAGVRHPDLNAANVLLAPDENGALDAWLLDVDRVWFDAPGHPRIFAANLRRLMRSARKWRDERGAQVDERELRDLARDARSASR